MSIMIMSRLFKMNLGGCNRKLLAVRLADFADDEGRGIYPGVSRLAEETELSERTIQRILADFEREGILVCRQRATGKRGLANSYDFDLEKLWAFVPGSNSKSTGDSVSPDPDDATGDIDASRGDTGDAMGCQGVTLTVIEPPLEPSKERGRERETREDRSALPGTADFTKRVQRFLAGTGYQQGEWPKWSRGTTISYIEKHFAALSEADRKAAETHRDAFLLKAGKGVMGAGNYFRDRAWEVLNDKDRAALKASAPAARPDNWAAAYGPAHAAMLFRILMAGPEYPDRAPEGRLWLSSHLQSAWPRLASFRQNTDLRGGVIAQQSDIEQATSMEFVTIDSALMAQWQAAISRKGWPDLRIPEGMRGHYFPKGGPHQHIDFSVSAKDEGDDYAA